MELLTSLGSAGATFVAVAAFLVLFLDDFGIVAKKLVSWHIWHDWEYSEDGRTRSCRRCPKSESM